jgi:DNA-binding CsgD family transcriptional regulator
MASAAILRSEARFKQLCCLGLGGEAVMPALVKELHTLVPSMRNMFFFANQTGGLDHVYTESMEHAATTQLYLQEFHGRRDRLIPGMSFDDAMRDQFGVHDLTAMRVDEKAFRRTDFYNLLFRPVGRGSDYVRLVMRERGRGLGMLTTFREPHDKHFSQEEKNRLAGLETFFVHALKDRSQTDVELVESGQTGLIVADLNGDPVYFSATGRQLLLRVMYPRLSQSSGSIRSNALPPRLRLLCHDLGRVFAGDDVPTAPAYYHRNIWGGFTFRAHLMRANNPGPDLIGITVVHHEPVPVKLVRQIGKMPLSKRQAEVCFLLANGVGYENIAERLGISKHTAIAHSRWIYNKLDVHNRAELFSKLLRDPA